MKRTNIIILLLLIMAACKSPSEKVAKSEYFDLKGYFARETSRLQQSNPLIRKTVMVNGLNEQKTIRISDWKKELSAFTDADINKRAWLGLFKQQANGHQQIYSSDNEKVPVKKLLINRSNNKISSIQIYIRNTNALYTSSDTLCYFPDSLYEINKTQQIRFMKSKRYKINGATQ